MVKDVMRLSGLTAAALLVSLGMTGCASRLFDPIPPSPVVVAPRSDWDEGRARAIPSLIYSTPADGPRPLAVLSHGYGGAPEDYAFLARALARRGYVVASIDHELPGDGPLPSTGNVLRDRTPSWEQSVRSIRLVRDALVADGIAQPGPIVLVGHSHGGDASMMMAALYSSEVFAVFSLDNRRYPLPRTTALRVCTLRSADQPADPGVLPDPVEAADFGIRMTVDPDLAHNDMTESATESQKARMADALLDCLA